MASNPNPLNPQTVLIDPKSGLMTREGFQFFQSIRENIVGGTFQDADATLTALAGLSTTAGLVTQTAADVFSMRTLVEPAAGLTIANPAGTAGNPTFSLANDLAALEALSGTGLANRTGANTWAQVTLATGTWSPTLTATANLDSITLTGIGAYLRISDRVIGVFHASADPTAAAGTATEFRFTLPVASDFTTVQDCLGAATSSGTQRAGMCYADTANDAGLAHFKAEGVAAIDIVCIFMYMIK